MTQAEHASAQRPVEPAVAALSPEAVVGLFRRATFALAALFVATGTVLALTIPFHYWDTLAHSEWSRLIADTGNFHFASFNDAYYHRPLFYALQGAVWWVVGFDERWGRLLSFGFAVLLLVCVERLARRGPQPALRATLAVLFLLLIPDFASNALGGLTDVPAAAMVALTAALAWRGSPSRARIALIVVAAALTVLAKPTGLVALGGLMLALAIGARSQLGLRLLRQVAPIAAGMGLALVYDGYEAHRLGESLPEFLTLGFGTQRNDYQAFLSDQVRWEVGWAVQWLGPYVALPLLFAFVYAPLRLARASHRTAALVGAPAALSLSWLLPLVALRGDELRVGPLASSGRLLEHLALALALGCSAFASRDSWPDRLTLARLLVWAFPSVAVWLISAPYATRLSSTAWPPLALLMAAVAVPAIAVATQERRALLAPAVGLMVVLVLFGAKNFSNFDGLGNEGWRQFRAAGLSGWTDQDRMRNLVLGAFTEELDIARTNIRPGERILSSDGRLRFYFPAQVDQMYPSSCQALKDRRLFVLLLDPESVAYLEQRVGASAKPEAWAACAFPELTPLGQRESVFAAFLVGEGRGAWEAVFGHRQSRAEADELLARVLSAGFSAAVIEQDGEGVYQIALEGLKPSQLREFREEAASAGFRIGFERG